MKTPKNFDREVRDVWRALRHERHDRSKLLSPDDLNETASRIIVHAQTLKVLATRPEARAAAENAKSTTVSPRPTRAKSTTTPRKSTRPAPSAKTAATPTSKRKTKTATRSKTGAKSGPAKRKA